METTTQYGSWILNIENDLKLIPKNNVMKLKSSVYTLELDSLDKEKLKKKLMSQLNYYWTACHYSVKQKKAFEHLCSNLYKDSSEMRILAFYEIEINNLKQYYENNKQIFELLDLYEDQNEKIINTLSESERTMLTQKISDTEKRLRKLDAHYKLINGKNFYTHGKTILKYIELLAKGKADNIL